MMFTRPLRPRPMTILMQVALLLLCQEQFGIVSSLKLESQAPESQASPVRKSKLGWHARARGNGTVDDFMTVNDFMEAAEAWYGEVDDSGNDRLEEAEWNAFFAGEAILNAITGAGGAIPAFSDVCNAQGCSASAEEVEDALRAAMGMADDDDEAATPSPTDPASSAPATPGPTIAGSSFVGLEAMRLFKVQAQTHPDWVDGALYEGGGAAYRTKVRADLDSYLTRKGYTDKQARCFIANTAASTNMKLRDAHPFVDPWCKTNKCYAADGKAISDYSGFNVMQMTQWIERACGFGAPAAGVAGYDGTPRAEAGACDLWGPEDLGLDPELYAAFIVDVQRTRSSAILAGDLSDITHEAVNIMERSALILDQARVCLPKPAGASACKTVENAPLVPDGTNLECAADGTTVINLLNIAKEGNALADETAAVLVTKARFNCSDLDHNLGFYNGNQAFKAPTWKQWDFVIDLERIERNSTKRTYTCTDHESAAPCTAADAVPADAYVTKAQATVSSPFPMYLNYYDIANGGTDPSGEQALRQELAMRARAQGLDMGDGSSHEWSNEMQQTVREQNWDGDWRGGADSDAASVKAFMDTQGQTKCTIDKTTGKITEACLRKVGTSCQHDVAVSGANDGCKYYREVYKNSCQAAAAAQVTGAQGCKWEPKMGCAAETQVEDLKEFFCTFGEKLTYWKHLRRLHLAFIAYGQARGFKGSGKEYLIGDCDVAKSHLARWRKAFKELVGIAEEDLTKLPLVGPALVILGRLLVFTTYNLQSKETPPLSSLFVGFSFLQQQTESEDQQEDVTTVQEVLADPHADTIQNVVGGFFSGLIYGAPEEPQFKL